ncbi:hypothetical protein Tco_0179840 [Tanacetum coccineum]
MLTVPVKLDKRTYINSDLWMLWRISQLLTRRPHHTGFVLGLRVPEQGTTFAKVYFLSLDYPVYATGRMRIIADFDPKEDPADGGDDDDDDDKSSDDEEDDDDDVEEDEVDDDEEEEEHPVLAVSVLYHPPFCTFITLPQPASPTYPLGYRAAMIRLRAESPSTSYLLPLPSPIVLPHTRAFVAMIRAAAPSTKILASRSEAPPSGTPPLLPIPLPTPSPPLLLPSTDCRAGVFEVTLLPRKRLYISLGPRYEVGESSSTPTARPTGGFRADYGFVGTLDDDIRDRRAHARTARLMETEAILSREAWVQSMDASDIARSEVRALQTIVLAQQAEIGALRATDHTRQAQLIKALTLMRTLQIQAMIDQGVSDALATRDADINMNGDDSHNLEAGVRWTERQGLVNIRSSPFEDLSDIGSLGVVGPEYEGLPWMLDDPYVQVILQAPPSQDYMLGPEEPEQAPPLPDFVPEPVYPEFMPSEDEVLPAKEQPLLAATSPTANFPGYVPESDPEEDPEEDDKEDPEEDPADRGDDGDDEDESSDDDEDDNETKPFESDESVATPLPHPAYRVTARISIRDEPPTPFWSDTEVARLLSIHTPPPSPLSPWSSPLPQIPSPPLPASPPLPLAPPPLPVSHTYPLGYRAAMIRLRAEASSTSHSPPPHIILSHTRADTPPSGTPPTGTPPLLPIPLPTSSPPFHLPSADHGADRPKVCLPSQKRLCIALGPRYAVEESSSATVARPTGDTYDEMLESLPGAPATDDTELGRRMTEFATRVRQDTYEIYVRLDDEQNEQQLMAGRLNMLYRDRLAHARTTLLMER